MLILGYFRIIPELLSCSRFPPQQSHPSLTFLLFIPRSFLSAPLGAGRLVCLTRILARMSVPCACVRSCMCFVQIVEEELGRMLFHLTFVLLSSIVLGDIEPLHLPSGAGREQALQDDI